MSAVDEIKRRIDPVAYIGRTVRLQKAGRNFRGLCPFHTEKTPSFYVFPDRGTWRCFGACGTGGDVFTFLEKKENLTPLEALRLLAERYGVDVPRPFVEERARPGAYAHHVRRVLEAVKAAVFRYHGLADES